jgi:hypothetical protein
MAAPKLEPADERPRCDKCDQLLSEREAEDPVELPPEADCGPEFVCDQCAAKYPQEKADELATLKALLRKRGDA